MGGGRARGRGVAAGVAALGVAGLLVESRRRLRNWGATREEARAPLRGDSLLPDAAEQTTRAVGVGAPPLAVWPWVVQIGEGRAGFYTYRWLERILGAAGRAGGEIDPALQSLRAGDEVRVLPAGPLRPARYYSVVEVDPGRALVMLSRRPSGTMVSWTLVVRPVPGGTRLIARTRHARPAARWRRVVQWAEITLLAPGHALMERGMLLGISRRAARR